MSVNKISCVAYILLSFNKCLIRFFFWGGSGGNKVAIETDYFDTGICDSDIKKAVACLSVARSLRKIASI